MKVISTVSKDAISYSAGLLTETTHIIWIKRRKIQTESNFLTFILESGNVVIADNIGDTMLFISIFEDVSNNFNKTVFEQVKIFIASFKSIENVQKKLIEFEFGL